MSERYVICPEKITGPFASKSYPWMPNNAPCAIKVPVLQEAPVMHFRCPRGHHFHAEPRHIREGEAE